MVWYTQSLYPNLPVLSTKLVSLLNSTSCSCDFWDGGRLTFEKLKPYSCSKYLRASSEVGGTSGFNRGAGAVALTLLTEA